MTPAGAKPTQAGAAVRAAAAAPKTRDAKTPPAARDGGAGRAPVGKKPAATKAGGRAAPKPRVPELRLARWITVKEMEAPDAGLSKGWPAPRQPAAGEDGLLAEAIRFHDFSSETITKPASFTRFDETTVPPALEPLRFHLHDATRKLVSALLANVEGELTKELVEQARGESPFRPKRGIQADVAPRVAARTLLLPEWRNPTRVEQLATPRTRRQVRFRRFEDLDAVLNGLRSLVVRARVQEQLRASFGAGLVAPWGGDQVVRRPGREPSEAPGGGYAAPGLTDVGITEKVYEQLATSAFARAHRTRTLGRAEIPPQPPGERPFRLHLDVATQVDVVLGELLPTADLRRPFQTWLENLDALEAPFLRACLGPDMATTAAAVGLPWAVALTAVLRAYVVELAGRVLMVSLPVDLVHDAENGYLGIALWEAWAGELITHVERSGYLTRDPSDPVLAVLGDWNVDGFTAAWSSEVAPHGAVADELAAMAAEPALLAREVRAGVVARLGSATFDELSRTFPTYPAYRVPGIRCYREADLYNGAHLSAQGHLFVATAILRVAIEDVGLPWQYSATKDEDPSLDRPLKGALVLTRPGSPPDQGPPPPSGLGVHGFELICGSYSWDGRNPPHKTHRDGATYDLQFGPNSLSWLAANDRIATLLDQLKRWNRSYVELNAMCLSKADEKAKFFSPTVFRGLVRDLINARLARLHEFLGGGVTPEEGAAYAESERVLEGTPHYIASGSAQQVHAGHVAILLSAPTQIIFGAPIAHLRAMRAIRLGLAGATPSQVPPLLRSASAVLRNADLVFMPHNHYHHWHVQYSDPGGAAADPGPAVERFVDLFPLWEALGIELAPFAQHLQGLTFLPAEGRPQLARVHEERRLLVEALRNYSPHPAGRRKLYDILMHLSADHPSNLVRPGQSTSLSPELLALVRETRREIELATTFELIERARDDFRSFGQALLSFEGGRPLRGFDGW